jgi:signal transduction histidine kinase
LASAEQEFLYMAPVELTDVVVDAARRWSDTPRLWKLGVMEEATIEGDADRLIMALDALIENAVEHTEVGDSIELSVHRETTQAVISVADTGSGIAAPETELIFDRFTRVDMSRNRKLGGFGLGLAIVKTIAQAHKGSVRVRSSKGKGSVFEVLLPLSGGQPTIRMSATPERTRGAARKVSLK